MKTLNIESMSADELWLLHEQIASELTRKLAAEKARLDQRLRQLSSSAPSGKMGRARSPYPRVFPKYINPAQPEETWAGRGKTPRWLTAQLKTGKKLDEFRIQPWADRARRFPS
jgi:DNA-binding protein H-NS